MQNDFLVKIVEETTQVRIIRSKEKRKEAETTLYKVLEPGEEKDKEAVNEVLEEKIVTVVLIQKVIVRENELQNLKEILENLNKVRKDL